MLMPKTSMHEDHDLASWENQIRLPGKTFRVQAIAQTRRVQRAPHAKFWLRVLTTNKRHLRASGWVNLIRRQHRQPRPVLDQ